MTDEAGQTVPTLSGGEEKPAVLIIGGLGEL